jgi:acetyltransferase-like isoleucine patch superfamily enzyme
MPKPIATRIFSWLTPYAREAYRLYLTRVWGMQIGKGSRVSLSARLDRTHPQGIHIGEETAIAFEVAILTHDFVNRRHVDVRIGKHCFIGARSIIMPGVTIGDNCIVASASVVMKDVPANSLVMGNPARVMESKILTSALGRREHAPQVTAGSATNSA